MRVSQKLLAVLVLSLGIISCSSTTKKENKAESDEKEQAMYQLPDMVDLQKAAKINIELGLNYLTQGQISRAKSKLTRAKNLAPQLPEVHYSYGYFLEYIGEVDSAAKSYQKAIRLNPKGGNEHNNYGTFLCRQNEFRKAEKEFLAAVEDPNYFNTAEAYENAGLCVLQIPDTEKAAEYFEKALRHDPKRTDALMELALIHFKENKLAYAQEYHKRYTQIGQPTARSTLLGMALAKQTGNKDKEASYRLLLKSQFPNANINDLYQVAKK